MVLRSDDQKLILASASPQRRQLLATAGYRFETVAPAAAAECGVCSHESPPELAARLAYQKAADVARRVRDAIILAADTVVECLGQILGKPTSPEHARQMLQLLRGRVHHVYTGVCLWKQPEPIIRVDVDVSRLYMEPISDEQLEDYLRSGAWQGKAGAFGYQDRLGWIRLLEGSESNVIGLPLELVERMLAELGYTRGTPS